MHISFTQVVLLVLWPFEHKCKSQKVPTEGDPNSLSLPVSFLFSPFHCSHMNRDLKWFALAYCYPFNHPTMSHNSKFCETWYFFCDSVQIWKLKTLCLFFRPCLCDEIDVQTSYTDYSSDCSCKSFFIFNENILFYYGICSY